MINTNISSYLQNGAIQSNNLKQNKDNNTSRTESLSKDSISVKISDNSKIMLKIDELESQLGEIFGVKKSLNFEERQKEKELQDKIKKINIRVKAPYSSLDKEKIKELSNKIENLITKEFYSYKDDEKLSLLSKQIYEIDKKYNTSELSFNNKQKEQLLEELRVLQGYEKPDVYSLIEAEKIFTKIKVYKNQLEISKLDINSNSYENKKNELENEIFTSKTKLEDLDISKHRYEEDQLRENYKSVIQSSLENISFIQNSFYNEQNSLFISLDTNSYSNLNTSTKISESQNKWANFLQDTKEDFYSSYEEQNLQKNEDDKLLSIVSNIRKLYQ